MNDVRSIYRFVIETRVQLDTSFQPIARYAQGGYDVRASYTPGGWNAKIEKIEIADDLSVTKSEISPTSLEGSKAFQAVAPMTGEIFRRAQRGERNKYPEFEN